MLYFKTKACSTYLWLVGIAVWPKTSGRMCQTQTTYAGDSVTNDTELRQMKRFGTGSASVVKAQLNNCADHHPGWRPDRDKP